MMITTTKMVRDGLWFWKPTKSGNFLHSCGCWPSSHILFTTKSGAGLKVCSKKLWNKERHIIFLSTPKMRDLLQCCKSLEKWSNLQCNALPWQWWCWWRWWDYFRVTLCILPLCLAPCSALRFSTKPHFANIYLLTLHILPKWDGRRIQTWDRTPRNRATETSTQKEDKTKIIKIFAGLLYFCHWPWSSELKTLTWFLAWLPL